MDCSEIVRISQFFDLFCTSRGVSPGQTEVWCDVWESEATERRPVLVGPSAVTWPQSGPSLSLGCCDGAGAGTQHPALPHQLQAAALLTSPSL